MPGGTQRRFHNGVVNRSALISPGYEAQLRQMHDAKMFAGGAHRHADEIKHLAAKVGAQTILDYGSGRASLKDHLPGFALSEYDPAVEGKDADPEPADLVLCIDVLEHIEPEKLGAVLDHLRELTRLVCFAVIATRPAEKRLPDNRNAHLVIDSGSWWASQFQDRGWQVGVKKYADGELIVWMRPPKAGGDNRNR